MVSSFFLKFSQVKLYHNQTLWGNAYFIPVRATLPLVLGIFYSENIITISKDKDIVFHQNKLHNEFSSC